jgi:excinuclease ABC subunit C
VPIAAAVPEENLQPWLAALPAAPAVFVLHGHESSRAPYIARTANLRRRLQRLLTPAQPGSKRLNLTGRIARLEYALTGSLFEESLLLVRANWQWYGAAAVKRLHLRAPALLRMSLENRYPRVYVTSRLSLRALGAFFGPFASRVAAERFLEEALNLFLLRRCVPDLAPDPRFPGCVYSEMKMCLAPCYEGCTDARYAEEVQRVEAFLRTRGESALQTLKQDRERASEALDFEEAARLHQRYEKVQAVAHLATPLVHALDALDAVIVQPAAGTPDSAAVAVFLVRAGCIVGPEMFSVAGMRHPNEHSGSSSLFAHPTRVEAVPLDTARAPVSRQGLEEQLQETLRRLEEQATATASPTERRAAELSLLARWYYRPAERRVGEIFFRNADGRFPQARILRGISRVFRGAAPDSEMPAAKQESVTTE